MKTVSKTEVCRIRLCESDKDSAVLFLRAEMCDTACVCAFYRYVCENTPDIGRFCRWIFGRHPTEEMICRYISDGCLYVLKAEGTLLAAAAFTESQGEDYHGIRWAAALPDDAFSVVHILCVHPGYLHKGLGGTLLSSLIQYAEQNDKAGVRLDALSCNEPAHRLYVQYGFVHRDTRKLYTANAGWIDFYYFERLFSKSTFSTPTRTKIPYISENHSRKP